ncbi:MAG: GSU2204 family CXXCH-containing (seleno)protein [bacterium]
MRNHRGVRVLAVVAVALLGMSHPETASAEDESASLEGTVSVGGYGASLDGVTGRVREYDVDREDLDPDLKLELFGWNETNRFDLRTEFRNETELDLDASLDAGKNVDVKFSHRSFYHSLDHDLLGNLGWRERVGVDSLGGDVGGGKMLTSEDTDPLAVYGVRVTDTKERLEVHVPVGTGTTFLAEYRNLSREGTRQVLGVDHCANCHVRGQTAVVDERMQQATLGLSTVLSEVKVGYRFSVRDFDNRAEAARNRFMQARHPVSGASGAEFASRLLYENETLEVSKTPNNLTRSHAVEVAVDLSGSQTVRGSYLRTDAENQSAGIKMETNAATLAWQARLARAVRASASLTRRELQNDSWELDLPNWREGRPGGGQDFDWTRLSAYDREEYLGSARLVWAARPGRNLRLDYALHSTDRDHVLLDPEDDSATRTVQNTIRATWSERIAKATRARLSAEYEHTSLPFVSVRGICEESGSDVFVPIDGGQPSDWLYYFQREKIGTGASLPTKAVRLKGNLTHGFGARASVSAYANAAFEKNDDLNLYDFERSVVAPGFSALLMPSDEFVFATGVAHSRIKSNAKLCVTVMDG